VFRKIGSILGIDVKSFDSANAIVAFGVLVTTLLVYTTTMAPTLSFWDCGEFITVATNLGIPHPPGTPVWVIIGRVFSMLPFFSDPSVRINFLSALTSALCAMFGYLIAVRLVRPWFSDGNSVFDRILLYSGAASGALFLAFGLTQWTNAVEAEVYGVALMLTAMIFWLSLIYVEHRGTPLASKVLLLTVFLAFLGVGVHMTVFLAFPVVAIPFVLRKSAEAKHWFAMGGFFIWELYLIFALSSRQGEVPFTVPVLAVATLFLFVALSFDKVSKIFWITLGGFALSVLPLGGAMADAIAVTAGKKAIFTPESLAALATLSAICFAVLVCFGGWLLTQWGKLRKVNHGEATAHLVAAAFIFVAALFVGILFVVKGYPAFMLLTVVSLGCLGIYMWRAINFPILIGIVGVALVMVGLKPFIAGMICAAVLLCVLGLSGKFPEWKTGVFVVLVAAMGWSAHLYLPIRSAQNPVYNQSDPSESLQAFMDFIERKQYGQKSMTERMLTRRAEWTHQFGTFQRMGFWGFFRDQFGITGVRFVVIFLIGLFAVWEIIRRNVFDGVPFLVLLLICSVGLILYMNFADGTRIDPVTGDDYLEVRDRDYFWTPFFVFFGLAIGMGLSLIIKMITDSVQSFSAVPRKIIASFSLVLLLSPAFAYANNHFAADRSRNYIPYDYAWNLLQSCEQNAICFTQGDNDTYPVWCLQQVYHVREDVKIVNLSLANTHWYIRQIQSTLGINLGWSDQAISQLGAVRNADGSITRLQVRVIDQIIATQMGKYPINFSVTCGADTRKFRGQSLDNRTTLMALQWRIGEVGGNNQVPVEEAYGFFMDPSRFVVRSANDNSIYKDDNTIRMVRNFANAMLVVADTLRRVNDLDRAVAITQRAAELVPFAADVPGYLGSLYAQGKQFDKLDALIAQSEGNARTGLQLMRSRAVLGDGDTVAAISALKEILGVDPKNAPAFEELMRIYYGRHDLAPIKSALEVWLANNPGDKRSASLLKMITDGKDIWDTTSR
jgi:tetratricopeptide (TPR) repeat protein